MILIDFLAVISLSYLAGSVPSSYIAGKILKSIDIRDFGSGNPGASNTFRILGKKAGLSVLLFDFFKGLLPVLVCKYYFNLFPDNASVTMIISGICVITGHIFPVWLKFRGGKGVASSAGVFTALYPLFFPVSVIIFCSALILLKKISAASIITAVSLPFTYLILNFLLNTERDPYITGFTLVIPLLIIIRHRSNIKRMFTGTEPDINANRKKNEET